MNETSPQAIDYKFGKGKHLVAMADRIWDYFIYRRGGAEIYHVVFTVEDGIITLHDRTLQRAGTDTGRLERGRAGIIINEIRSCLAKNWETALR